MKFLKDNWKALLLVLMAVVAFPLILILSFNNKSPFDNVYGSNDAWIGFWGSYAGGLMTASASGGLAYYISKKEAKETRNEIKEDRRKEEKRKTITRNYASFKADILEVIEVLTKQDVKMQEFLALAERFVALDCDIELAKLLLTSEVVDINLRRELGVKLDMLENVQLSSLFVASTNTQLYIKVIYPLQDTLYTYLNMPDHIKHQIDFYIKLFPEFLSFYTEESRKEIIERGIQEKEKMPYFIDKQTNDINRNLEGFNKLKRTIQSTLDEQLEKILDQYI